MVPFRWLSKPGRRGRPAWRAPARAARRQAFRPGVEALEGRVLPTVYLVTSTADSGPGSLRQAILDANAHAGADSIAFVVNGGGLQTIAPLSPLPAVTDPVTLDATTQPGYAGTPLIVLDGSAAGFTNGLVLNTGNSTVSGLDIQGFQGYGVVVQSGSGNLITANYIGTDVSGTAAAGNGGGVFVSSPNNRVGATGLYPDNVISGNAGDGVTIAGPGATGNVIDGNFIGLDANGTAAVGNGGDGVGVTANNNSVGRTANLGNVISGNGGAGVLLAGFGNLVTASYIGTDYTGSVAQPNGTGVDIEVSGNTIGNAGSGAGNVISGNLNDGVRITSSNNVVRNNFIGTDASGGFAVGNGGAGVELVQTSFVAVNNNNIGGMAFLGNIISGNLGAGILFSGGGSSSSQSNRVIANFIGTDITGSYAIGNGGDGVTVSGNNTSFNTIGGTAPGLGNLISGNGGNGVSILSPAGAQTVFNNAVQGNVIGTDSAGDPLGNAGDGVLISGVPQAGSNTVGGTAASAANTIADNGNDGVRVIGVFGNSIRRNSIYGHANGLGIELSGGGNLDQAAPVVTSAATVLGRTTTVQGFLQSTPSRTFALELFVNSVCNPSGFGEAQRYVVTTNTTTNSGGFASFSVTFAPAIPPDLFITATATDPGGNTSAFSACQQVSGGGAPGSGTPALDLAAFAAARDARIEQPALMMSGHGVRVDEGRPVAPAAPAARDEREQHPTDGFVRLRLDDFFAHVEPAGLVDLPDPVAHPVGAAD